MMGVALTGLTVLAMGTLSCSSKSGETVETEEAAAAVETEQDGDAVNTDAEAAAEVAENGAEVAEAEAASQTAETDAAAQQAEAEKAAPKEKKSAEKKDAYSTTASGLKYKVLKKGDGKGKSPKATDVVMVHYEGRLLDGTVFDSSYQRQQPTQFPLNRVIAGWTEGLQLMQEGDTYEFLIPSKLAYGERGGGPIPPNSDLIFKVELIKVGQ